MGNSICLICGQSTATIIAEGKKIHKKGFDYCVQCQKSLHPTTYHHRPRWSKRSPEEIEKPPEEFERDRRRILAGEDPSQVDPIYNRRNPWFSKV